MKEVKSIKPFMYPCQGCNGYKMHEILSQPYGLTIRVPFMQPLASTHTAFHVVCMTCTTVNESKMNKEYVTILKNGYIPKAFYTAYPYLHEFYTPGYFDLNKNELTESMTKEEIDYLEKAIKHYSFEV